MRSGITLFDRYILRLSVGTLMAVLGIVMSLMVLEHLPRLIEITRLSGHRGLIIGQTISGLLPEYGGIGLVVGLYLAIAMAVRKLAMRGELDAIEASGVGPARWMRMQVALAFVVGVVIVVNQGWLMPWGEQRLEDIGRRMDAGEFGYNVKPNEAIDLGNGHFLTFKGVSRDGSALENVFLVEGDSSYAAASGHISMGPNGGVVVKLIDGQTVEAGDGRVTNFAELEFHDRGQPIVQAEAGADVAFKRVSITQLLGRSDPAARAAAYARLLWGLIALLTPVMGLVLGRPPRRSSSALSLFLGLIIVVGFIKAISLVDHYRGAYPEMGALGIATVMVAVVAALGWCTRHAGPGCFDEMVMRQMRRWSHRGGSDDTEGESERSPLLRLLMGRRRDFSGPALPSP